MSEAYIQYYVWNKSRKILKGPFQTINQPSWTREVFVRETVEAYFDADPLRADPTWIGGTLESILRTPGVDRFEIAAALKVTR